MATKGEVTRQRIIEKSMQLFSVQGYFNTSIAGIVKATGLTKGGLYGHFRNKEEIWYAVYDECVRIWKGVVFQGVRQREAVIDDDILRGQDCFGEMKAVITRINADLITVPGDLHNALMYK